MGVSFGVQRPYTIRPQTNSYETLYFRPNIAVFWVIGGHCLIRHSQPDLLAYLESPGHRCHEIRLNICERYCVTPNTLNGRSGQSWQLKSSGIGVSRQPNLWNMPTLQSVQLETPSRQSFQVLTIMLLAFLSQALGLLKTSMGP